jgi:DNA repair protein RecN (Recombination protein N)
MLTHLSIKNFTIIENLNIDLQRGMIVLTGETGAGKSIIIDSLKLVLGSRSDNKMIKHGCKRCEITAIFDLQNISGAKQWLKDHGMSNDDNEEECIINRIISDDGPSRSIINGILCPQQQTRELGSLLINIHGQHEYQTISKRDQQRNLLDIFAKHKNLSDQVELIYSTWQQANTKLIQLQQLTANHDSQVELLNYQIKELDELALQENESEDLYQEHKRLVNAEQLLNDCNAVLDIINENNLSIAHNKLIGIKEIDSKIDATYELFNNAIIQIEEADLELRRYLDTINLDSERLHWVEQRLSTIHNLARKHHVKSEGLYNLHKDLTLQLKQLNDSENDLKETSQQVEKLSLDYKEAANKLTISREQAARKLSQQVTEQMQQLNMPQGEFAIRLVPLKEKSFSANGLEQIEFLVTTNPGQPLQPLSKVASGGELSRISLAVQTLTAQQEMTPTLIFDEVDVGIGGKVAEIVGRLLKSLSCSTQVICITHLPQIAALGHQHIRVSKEIKGNTTVTQVETLANETRIEEVARMLGGIKITKQTLAHAKEMCDITKNEL